MLVMCGFVGLLFVWTVFINFIAKEAIQPLDFYSNKLRTRPYWLVIVVVVLGGGLAANFLTGKLKLLNEGLPEVAVAMYLQALCIGLMTLFQGSAATALTALCLYGFVGSALCMVALAPTLPFNRPGVWYAVLFFLANIAFVVWSRLGIKRYINQDVEAKCWPSGSERLFEIWAEAVMKWSLLMAVLTTLAYGVHYLQFVGEYGYACALTYYVVAFLLVLGCCRQFKTGTGLE